MKTNRDDFSEEVKRIVAQRVNYRCSRCDAPTSGPQRDPTKALNVGVASHITAAAPGGARYDASLTPEQRKHHTNAIWLCQTCGKLADNDESMFTVAELKRWKLASEARALAQIGMASIAARSNQTALSAEEIELLIAAEGADGEIHKFVCNELPDFLLVGGHEFQDKTDRAVAAIHLEALDSIIKRGLVKYEGGVLYELTGSGWRLARELKALRDSTL